ncbi:MAG: TlpA family protein disulfide reductase [Marinilabiliales bacterium]|nr:MAG: TlpA family protein disulfide reductase [Marinilabiliales bacterium]
MRKLILLISVNLFISAAIAQVPAMNFDDLKPRLTTRSDSVYVVNFWATWCVPCVKELPEFEKINEVYSDRKVKVILVSLDNPRHMESRLLPFIREHNLRSEIILLDDPRSNRWIPMVDETWSGAIPATIIFNRETRSFYEKVFTYEELENIIEAKLN